MSAGMNHTFSMRDVKKNDFPPFATVDSTVAEKKEQGLQISPAETERKHFSSELFRCSENARALQNLSYAECDEMRRTPTEHTRVSAVSAKITFDGYSF